MLKKVMIHTKRSIKVIILFAISIFLIVGAIAFLYKPTYSVFINGEQIGYTENKSELQNKINNYIENGEEENQNIAFVQVDNLPKYQLCLLKKDITPNDEEIFEKVKEQGIPYYRYYAILDNNEEKIYVSTFEEAENVVQGLKDKKSNNTEKISIVEKYEQNLAEITTTEDAISKLYVAPPVQKVSVSSKKTSNTTKYVSSGTYSNASTISTAKVDLGISFIKPVSGIISSRYGSAESVRNFRTHAGLDIAAAAGTPILAAAAGTVTYSGWMSGYGNFLIVTHANGVQTCYGHCSKLYVSAGASVSQGQQIAAVGSTGNSTGPHLHLEIRKNGVKYNPQLYIY